MGKADLKAISETASSKEILDSPDEQTYENVEEIVAPFYAAEKLEQAGRAKSDLGIKRSKGVRKATTRFVKFAKTFQEFLAVYSGIVDIMASLPHPFLCVSADSYRNQPAINTADWPTGLYPCFSV